MAEEEEDIEILMSRNGLIDDVLYWPDAEGSGGGITGVVYSYDASVPNIAGQTITHPYAQTNTEGSSVAGVVSGEISISHVSAPLIENGKIYLPLAQYSESYGVTLGLVGKIEYNSAVSAPSVQDGVITLPSNGGITSADFSSPNERPWVENNVLHIPYANQYYNSSVGTPGVIDSFQIGNYYAPQIDNGCIGLPYAQTAYGGSRVTGALTGDIKISNVSAPCISYGNMILPYAQYENGSSVTGLIAGVTTSAVSTPIIQDGQLILPQSAGTVLGLRDMYGNPIAWESLYTSGSQQTSLAQFTAGGTTLTLCVNYSDGYLNFEFRS